jgi:hypothetical protein
MTYKLHAGEEALAADLAARYVKNPNNISIEDDLQSEIDPYAGYRQYYYPSPNPMGNTFAVGNTPGQFDAIVEKARSIVLERSK